MNGNDWMSCGRKAGAYALFVTRFKQNVMRPPLGVGHKPELTQSEFMAVNPLAIHLCIFLLRSSVKIAGFFKAEKGPVGV